MTHLSFNSLCLLRRACVALAAAMLCPGLSALADDAGMKAAYLQKIKSIDRKASNRGGAYRYTLLDIDGDGTPELLIHGGTCSADMAVSVYTWNSGKLIHLDDLPGQSECLNGNNCLFLLETAMGGYWTEFKITKKGLKLVGVVVGEGEFPEEEDIAWSAEARQATELNWHDMTDVKQLQGTSATGSKGKRTTGKRRSHGKR